LAALVAADYRLHAPLSYRTPPPLSIHYTTRDVRTQPSLKKYNNNLIVKKIYALTIAADEMDTYSVDVVYQAISALFQGNNPKEQEKANKWLQDFQKSVSASRPVY